jgi:PmbA protein
MDKLNLLTDLINKAKKYGADAADGIIISSADLSTEVRLGNVVNIERSESMAIGLRVLVNQQQAMVSTTDLQKKSLDEILERAVAIAKVTPPNSHLFLATKEQMVSEIKDLDLYDAVEPSAEILIQRAKAAEQAALDNKKITNSEGSSASYSANKIYFATSNDFHHHYQSSSSSIAVEVLSGEGANMQTGGDYSLSRFAEDLKNPEEIGLEAAKRAIEKLNPRKLVSAEMPVIFDRRVAKRLVSAFAGAINGFSISRGSSFLVNHLDKEIFSPSINIIDDPFLIRGLSSRPFDAEAILGSRLNIVEQGKLNHYLLDLQTASNLKMETTGHAVRGLSSAPSPSATNMYINNGKDSLETMIKSLKKGLLVTEVFCHGANIVTGDYSQGVVGFYIENGVINYPVSEITIASNLKNMFKLMSAANDLKFDSNINSPSLMIDNMTIAGV